MKLYYGLIKIENLKIRATTISRDFYDPENGKIRKIRAITVSRETFSPEQTKNKELVRFIGEIIILLTQLIILSNIQSMLYSYTWVFGF